MKTNMPWEQLAKYFAGELEGEEYQKMKTWIVADSDREKSVETLYKIWKESEISPHSLDVDEAWGRLAGSIERFENNQNTEPVRGNIRNIGHAEFARIKKHPARNARRYILAAAVVLVMISAGLFTYILQVDSHNPDLAENDNRVLTTRHGERASYLLADGSRVLLHAGSRLEIPENYNMEKRELHLQGEAYFEAAHNPDKPFIIHSKHSYTRVVGTRFLVQSWSEATQEIEVIVSEGRVLFGDSRTLETDEIQEVLLTQNQRGVLTETGGPTVNEVEDMSWYMGWTEGRLVFEDRALKDVFPRLERWYDVIIEIENKELAEKRITAEIDYSLPMSDVLEGIALSLGLNMEQAGRNITFGM